MSTKNPPTPAGIEPATFRFVAQRLKHCATAVPDNISDACPKYRDEAGGLSDYISQLPYQSIVGRFHVIPLHLLFRLFSYIWR